MIAWRRTLPWILAAIVAAIGWRATWFLCDDAFIAFRYVGNAHDGNGLVWNAAPFLPVEGYTSFLWVGLLWFVWGATGVEPPVSSNWLSLACALGTLLLVARFAARMALPARAERWRNVLAAIVLVGAAGNATFATWASSGLETALFGLCAVGWTLHAAAPRRAWRPRDLAGLAAWAALAQLTRPDGALLTLATLALAAQRTQVGAMPWRRTALGLLPLALPAAHLLWRRAYYGEWLPNTYYAKVTAPWPDCGACYLFCFLCEHGAFVLLPVAGIALALALRGGRAPLGTAIAVFTWLGYVAYYTLVVGGDHFGYRIYAHFVPLLLLAGLWAAASLRLPGPLAAAWLALLAIATDGPGWVLERALQGHEDEGYVRASTVAPKPLRPLFAWYDRCQAYCRVHSVGIHRVVHARFCDAVRAAFPERRPGQIAGSRPGMRLVCRSEAVGVFGWALADLSILDGHGLNDWYIARSPAPAPAERAIDGATLRAAVPGFDRDGDGRLDAAELAGGSSFFGSSGVALYPATWAQLLLALGDRDGDERLDVGELAAAIACILPVRHMAHERWPDPDYIAAFRPNVASTGRNVLPDVAPLTDAELRAVELRYRAAARAERTLTREVPCVSPSGTAPR